MTVSDAIKPDAAPAAAAPVSEPAQTPAEAAPAPARPEPRRITRQAAPAPAAPVAAPAQATEPKPSEQPERGSRLLARMRAQIERDRAAVEEAKAYRAELAEYAKGALDGLTKEQRGYVEKLAGDNPAKLLATVRELRAAGLLPAQGASAAPANTAPRAPTAPAGSSAGDTDSAHLAEYERLRKVAPVVALDYQQRHAAAIQRARSSRTNN